MKATLLKKIWSQPQIEELGTDQTLGGFFPTTKETITTIFGNLNNFGKVPGCVSGPLAKCK